MINSPDTQPQNQQDIIEKYSRSPNENDLKWVRPGTRIIDVEYHRTKDSNGNYKEKIKYPFEYKDVPKIPNGLTKDDIVYEMPCFMKGIKFHIAGEGADFYQGVMVGRIAIIEKSGFSVAIWDQRGEMRIISGNGALQEVAKKILINYHQKEIALLEGNPEKANKHLNSMENIFINYPPIAKAIDDFSKGKKSFDQIALNIKTTLGI